MKTKQLRTRDVEDEMTFGYVMFSTPSAEFSSGARD
jgi:hypothetical protein